MTISSLYTFHVSNHQDLVGLLTNRSTLRHQREKVVYVIRLPSLEDIERLFECLEMNPVSTKCVEETRDLKCRHARVSNPYYCYSTAGTFTLYSSVCV